MIIHQTHLQLKCKWKPATDGHVLDDKFIYGEDDDDSLGLNYAAGLKEANRRGDAALYVVKTGEEANKMADLAAESGAVTGKALDGTNAENLASAFDFIYQSITVSSTVQIFSFNDELSQWVDPVDFADQPDGADITRFITVRNGTSKLTNYKAYYRVNSSGSRTVNVVLNGSSGIAAGESDVLDVSFRIKPNDAVYKDFAEKKTYPNVGDSGTGSASSGMPGYFTNGDANMSYCHKLDVNGTVSCQPETVNFGRPVMQVRLGRIDIVKHWSDGADKHANDTVTVQLQRSASGGPAENVGNPIELNAANNWTAQVDGLLPGYTYTVVETSQDDRYAVTYTYGDSSSSTGAELTKQMVWGSLPDTGTLHADITNTLETASLSNAIKVQKKIDGRDWRDSDEFTFTLTPTDSSNPMPVECANQNSCTVAVNAKSPGHTGAFGDITYEAGAREYRYTVAEQAGSAPAMHYSKARYNIVVKVEKAQDGKWTARLSSITQVSDDNGGTGKETSEPTMPITFTNTYTAVAALPLTGGATARTWLLTSGSLGVLALLLLVGLAAQKRGTLLI